MEAVEKMRKGQLLFLKRSVHSVNELVKYVGWINYRRKGRFGQNLFASTYEDFKMKF